MATVKVAPGKSKDVSSSYRTERGFRRSVISSHELQKTPATLLDIALPNLIR
jgi:hypothetical protein